MGWPSTVWFWTSRASTHFTPHHHPSIESIVGSMKDSMHKDPSHQIDILIQYIDYHLSTTQGKQEEEAPAASCSSSGFHLEDVSSTIKTASELIETISTEAGNLADTEIGKDYLVNVALRAVKAAGEAHWVFFGLSMVASTIETYVKVGSNYEECRNLLEDIVSLAKEIKKLREALPEKSEKVSKAVQLIVEGAIMCCGFMFEGKFTRYCSAATQEMQLQKTRECLRDVESSLSLTAGINTLVSVNRLERQLTRRVQQSPRTLLHFKPEGIEDQVEKVKEMLDMEGSDRAIAVILCGIGGVGKSTLAASVIQQLNWTSTDFKFCMVRINQEAADRVSHIVKLQQEIILGLGGQKLSFSDPAVGRSQLQKVMESKSSFLFIDNVADKYYIEELLPEDLSPGVQPIRMNASLEKMQKSKVRMLITSTENNLRSILNSKKCKTCREHRVNHLCDEAAKRLLMGKILEGEGENQSKPYKDFDEEDYMDRVAKACKGVPLLLSAFGKHLAVKRDADSYQEALSALEQGHPDRFTDKDHLCRHLLFVYDKMENAEAQEAFLDICIYFHGWDWNLVSDILDKENVEVLRNKMLVDRSDKGTVIVQDVLRLLGTQIAKGTRFTNYDELSSISDNKSKLKNVRGIALLSDKTVIRLESTHLNAMRHSLRVLQLGDWVSLDGPPSERAFPNLRYLQVGDMHVFPFKDASKLQKLKYFSNKSKPGMELPQLPQTLKFLSHQATHLDLIALESFYVKLPQGFKLPASLVSLDLSSCTHLPETFNHLTALERLILDKCDMESLPHGFGKLNKLKHLSLENCTNLTSLPAGFGSLHSLIYLNLHGCTHLEKISEEFSKLSSLKELNIEECESLSALPKDLGSLPSLQKLDLAGCTHLQRLPESLWRLPIGSLTLRDLHCLEEIPQHTTESIPCLTSLVLISCNSLTTLPNSFVQFTKLETLKIVDCIELLALPGGFGQLISLKEMSVDGCPRLKELPHGFQVLPALKSLMLQGCSSLVNLPTGFGELPCLENLTLSLMPLSTLPIGFEELKRLKFLEIYCCNKLEGAAMDRIVNLQHCLFANIEGSSKLIKRWEEIQNGDHFMLVLTSKERLGEDLLRAIRAALFGGEDEEPPPVDTTVTVAVIRLPIHMEERHPVYLQRVTRKAMEIAKTDSSEQLKIVYVKNVPLFDQMPEKEQEEEEEEKKVVTEIMEWVSKTEGSNSGMGVPFTSMILIPSTDIRRLSLIQYLFFQDNGKLAFRLGHLRVDNKGIQRSWANTVFASEEDFPKNWNPDFVDEEHEIPTQESSEEIPDQESSEEIPDQDSSEEIPDQESSESLFEENETFSPVANTEGEESDGYSLGKSPNLQMFLQTLKENNIHHFSLSNKSMAVEQLKGKEVSIIICGLNIVEFIILQKIYNDYQVKDFNFEWVWIPLLKNGDYGIGSYTRAIQYMPWASLPNPKLFNITDENSRCIMFDKEGKKINEDALSLMISWGATAYPYTQYKTNEIVFNMLSKSSLEFLFQDMDFIGSQGVEVKEELNNKLIFLYAEPPSQKLKLKSKLEQLIQEHEDFEVLYVGHFFDIEQKDVGTLKKVYEDATQNMQWPKLSFCDMIKFWYRCKYLSNEVGDQLHVPLTLQQLVKYLYIEKRWLIFLDCDGVITGSGNEVVEMICKSTTEITNKLDIIMKKGLMQSLKTRESNEMLKVYFRDELSGYPYHPQHPLLLRYKQEVLFCNSCFSKIVAAPDQKRIYSCNEDCNWDLCGDCWEVFVKQQVRDLTPTKDKWINRQLKSK